jgi:inorganic pyrophosphatase
MGFPDPFYRWRPHPWHGLQPGPDAPRVVLAYIELTPFDVVKYEVDKATGYLRVDRPQSGSSAPPSLYGFVPRTYCAERVRALSPSAECGDGDPLDICVISERPISKADIVLDARVIGGFQMVDGGEADDKVIAVLDSDPVLKDVHDIADAAPVLIERMRHYFLTYKLCPGERATVTIESTYGREHALRVVEASLQDYQDTFGD